MNGKDWTKNFIQRVLRITRSQWILRNMCLHEKTEGYLRQKETEETKDTAEVLSETNPINLPEESRFLLEMDGSRSVKGTYNEMNYWIGSVKAAKIAGQRIVERRQKPRRQNKMTGSKKAGREILGVRRVEREVEKDMRRLVDSG